MSSAPSVSSCSTILTEAPSRTAATEAARLAHPAAIECRYDKSVCKVTSMAQDYLGRTEYVSKVSDTMARNAWEAFALAEL